jgi:hypothetical protein
MWWFRLRIWLLKLMFRSLFSNIAHYKITPQIYFLVYDAYQKSIINKESLDAYSDFNIKSHLFMCNSELEVYFKQSLWKK